MRECEWQTRERRLRPSSLSDPFHDNNPESLRSLLTLPDIDLKFSDFRILLGPYLPAGTYAETVYFLPILFKHMHNHPDDCLDLCTTAAWYISEHTDLLESDGILDDAADALNGCLVKWTADFQVIHYDRTACETKGWSLTYMDYVVGEEAVCEFLNDLIEFENQANIAENFIYKMVHDDRGLSCAAWHLNLAASYGEVYSPPKLPAIKKNLLLRPALKSAADMVRNEPEMLAVSPTYWNDVFVKLGL